MIYNMTALGPHVVRISPAQLLPKFISYFSLSPSLSAPNLSLSLGDHRLQGLELCILKELLLVAPGKGMQALTHPGRWSAGAAG